MLVVARARNQLYLLFHAKKLDMKKGGKTRIYDPSITMVIPV
jgi:hypothetical protein